MAPSLWPDPRTQASRRPAQHVDWGSQRCFRRCSSSLGCLSSTTSSSGWTDWSGAAGQPARRRAQIEAYLARLLDQDIDVEAPVGSLGLGVGQVCAIVRALMQAPRVLLLDEATSALDFRVRDRLFEIIRELRTAGVATAFISHRMDEVETIADRVTVLRSGSTVSTLDRSEATPATLFRLMSGVETPLAAGRTIARTHEADPSFAIAVDGVVLREGAKPFDAKVHAGEVVGLGGLEGHGQEVFLQTLAGLRRPFAGSVSAIQEGATRAIANANDAAAMGVAYVPRDRKAEGIFAPLSVLDNFVMPSISRDSRWGLLSIRGMIRRYQTFARGVRDQGGAPVPPDHVVERRQPAEGHNRSLARDGTPRAAAQRPHPRRRSCDQAGHLREAARDRSEGHRDRDALDGSR